MIYYKSSIKNDIGSLNKKDFESLLNAIESATIPTSDRVTAFIVNGFRVCYITDEFGSHIILYIKKLESVKS